MMAALNMVQCKKLDIPFIIVSGAIGEEAAVAAMRSGARDYVMKDNLTRLVPAVERELNEAQTRRERKWMEQDKERLEKQLELAGRLASVGELTAGVAHELNNPIAAVQGFAQLLTVREDLDESLKEDLEIIYREAQRAARITGNLLSFARQHKPKKRSISINEALKQSLELHAYRMKVNNVNVIMELDPDQPKTMADFHQIQQVFVNIITNAEQAMSDSGIQSELCLKTETVDDKILVYISDNGPGVPKENIKRIFDPFFTTKDVGKGTGLGLSICNGIIRAHGGHISVKAFPKKGTTFVIEIPLIPEDTCTEGQPQADCSA
jgi:two-component system NtrC family sensor kinase